MFQISKRVISMILAFTMVFTLLTIGTTAQAFDPTPIPIPIHVDGTNSNFSGLVSDNSGKTLLSSTGSTVVNADHFLQLTKSEISKVGTVVRRTPIQLDNGFSTYFVVNMANLLGDGGDGLCFIVYDSANGVQSGGSGINLGYSDYDNHGAIITGDSVAFELDTYCNDRWENLPTKPSTYRHVAIDTNDWDGVRPNNTPDIRFDASNTGANILHSFFADTTSTDITSPTDDASDRIAHSYSSLNDGSDIHVWVDLKKNNDGTSEVVVTYGKSNTRTSNSNYTFQRKLANQNLLNKSVYVGFSASTGSVAEDHVIKKWSFSNTPIGGGIDPSSTAYEQAASTVSLSLSSASNPAAATVNLFDASGAAIGGTADIYIDGTCTASNVSVSTSGSPYSIPSGLGIGNHAIQAIAPGGSSAKANFSVAAVATVNVKLDGSASSSPVTGALELWQTGAKVCAMSGTSGVYTATVPDGIYNVYISGSDTGKTLTISGGNGSTTVDYYTVRFAASNAGTASGSTISAMVDSSVIPSGTAVLSGKSVLLTCVGAGTDTYTYLWSGGGVSSQTTPILSITSLSNMVNAICTVTGSIRPTGSGSNTPPPKTINVTETSSGLFPSSSGAVLAEANMSNAFSGSVEVKVTDTKQGGASFGFGTGTDVYPFDISLYVKGTNTKTQPASGYAVTISLPIPNNLLSVKDKVFIAHKSKDGTVTPLTSNLKQINGSWYLVFKATEFSPYALVVNNLSSYDAMSGLPYYLKGNENKVFLGFAAGGKYLAPSGMTILLAPNPKKFTDISTHWAKSYIDFVTERELFMGTAANVFSPDTGMTRAMFATVIGRLYERSYGEISTSKNHTFMDCQYDDYYGKYVDWSAGNGIIEGVGGGLFQPDRQVSRQEMATMLYRFSEFLKLTNSTSKSGTLSYSDASSIASWATNAALYSQDSGLITGRSGGIFAPTETATRAEVSAIIQRFIQLCLK